MTGASHNRYRSRYSGTGETDAGAEEDMGAGDDRGHRAGAGARDHRRRGVDPDKFAKVLALVESDHHGEAQSALRAARIMLAKAGMSFRDLAGLVEDPTPGAAPRPSPVRARSSPSAPSATPAPPASHDAQSRRIQELEQEVLALEQQVAELRRTREQQKRELARQKEETTRWHKLARETVERLWDIGKTIEKPQRFSTTEGKHKALVDMLNDPATARWSDSEISRRLGIPQQRVSYWRWRMALMHRDQIRLKGDFLRVKGGRGLARHAGAQPGWRNR